METNEKVSMRIKDKVQKIGFWVTIFILFGFGIGFYTSKYLFKSYTTDVIKTKRMIYDNKIYDISENIILTTEANSKPVVHDVKIQTQQPQNSIEVSKK